MRANVALPGQSHNQLTINIVEHNTEPKKKVRFSEIRRKCGLIYLGLLDLIIYLLVLFLIYILEYGFIPTVKVGFFCHDPTLSYPYNGDTIAGKNMIIGSLLIPLCVIIFIEIIRTNSIKGITVKKVWRYYKVTVVGLPFLLLITAIIKTFIGELRPHFFVSCIPDANQNCIPGTFIQNYNCTNDKLSKLDEIDLHRSFPSGQTTGSSFVSLYCAYLLMVRLSERKVSITCRSLLITLCFLWAIVCSSTGLTDRSYYSVDVFGGVALAFSAVSYYVYRSTKKEIEFIRSNSDESDHITIQ